MEKVTLICPKCGEEVHGQGKNLVDAQCDASYNLLDHQEKGCKQPVSRPEYVK